jgi:tetratricopeptide (TPR) repeat protein
MHAYLPTKGEPMALRRSWASARRYGAATLLAACLSGGGVLAQAQEGQADLDAATQQKITARTGDDLKKVVDLVESALKKGLDEENTTFAKQLLTSSLYQQAEDMANRITEQSPPPQEWPRLRRESLKLLERAVEVDQDQYDAHLLIAKLNALPRGDREEGLASADEAVRLAKDDTPKLVEALLVRIALAEEDDQRIADLNQILAVDDSNVKALLMRGMLLAQSDEFEKALADFQKVLESDAENLPALQASIESLFQLERYDEAEAILQKVIDKAPENAELHIMRAKLLLAQKKNDEARAAMDKAVELAPDALLPRLTRAEMAIQQERYAEAEADLSKLLAAQPGLVQALLLRSIANAGQEKWDAAIIDMKKLVDSAPGEISWKLQLALYYNASDRPRKAIELFTEALELEPASIEALRGRADAYLSIGEHEKALPDYEKILEQDPKHEGALNNYAWVLATSPKDNVRNAKKSLEYALKAVEASEGKKPHILSTLGAAYAENGDWEKALEWSKKAVAMAEDEEMRAQLQKEVESYEKKEPVREIQQTEEKPDVEIPGDDDFDL